MNSIKFQEKLFSMSDWSSLLSKFGAKTTVTKENKATSNIRQVIKKN